MKQENIRAGMPVLYMKSKDHVELGIVKRVSHNGAFVRYHMGDTAANTPAHMLTPIFNEYSFQIIRKDVNNEVKTQHARQLATLIAENIQQLFEADIINKDTINSIPVIEFITQTIENRKNQEVVY